MALRADRLLDTILPDNQDFVNRKLTKLRQERKDTDARLQDLQATNFEPPDIDATVDAILAQLNDFSRVAAQGTVEERKQFVRAFVSGISLDPPKLEGVVQLTALPLPCSAAEAFTVDFSTLSC